MSDGDKALSGCRVLVTRARAQAAELIENLEEQGAVVDHFAAIDVAAPPSWDSLDAVVDHIASWDWIVFTSSNGVDSFFQRLAQKGRGVQSLAGIAIAVVGRATAAALRSRGVEPDAMPAKARSGEIADAMPEAGSGSKVAIIRALVGREELIDELRARGATVHLAIGYQTRGAETMPDDLRRSLVDGAIDVLTFTSPSTVENVLRHLSGNERARLVSSASFVSIGPTTTAALEAAGVTGVVQAAEATISSLVDAVVDAWEKLNG